MKKRNEHIEYVNNIRIDRYRQIAIPKMQHGAVKLSCPHLSTLQLKLEQCGAREIDPINVMAGPLNVGVSQNMALHKIASEGEII